MRSAKAGHASSAVEVVNISQKGIRLLVRGQELFLSFREFPWFEDATVRELSLVESLGTDHLYWPALDADVSIDSIEHPERYPLVFRGDLASTGRAMAKTNIAVTIDTHLLKRIDRMVRTARFPSRSAVVESALKEKLERMDRTRLVRECAKLNKSEERVLADERWAADLRELPER